MEKFLSYFLIFFICTNCTAQTSIGEYKAVADKAIKKYFSEPVYKKLKCDSYFAQELDNGRPGKLGGHKYEQYKNTRITTGLISLFYQLYAKDLNYEFTFSISVDSNMNTYLANGGFSDIPSCVRQNKHCNYITRAEAIKIAIADSIEYADNLLAMIKKPKSSIDYYWVVNGQDKKNIDYSVNPKDGWPQKRGNTRYINAITGKGLSYDEFQKLDE